MTTKTTTPDFKFSQTMNTGNAWTPFPGIDNNNYSFQPFGWNNPQSFPMQSFRSNDSQWHAMPFTGQTTFQVPMTRGFASPAQGFNQQTMMNQFFRNPTIANVRFVDNDTEVIFEIQTPGFNTETTEITAMGDQIRVRVFVQTGAGSGDNVPFMLTLPMPSLGDMNQIKASAANDFLRITVPTRKEIVDTFKKIKPTKIQ